MRLFIFREWSPSCVLFSPLTLLSHCHVPIIISVNLSPSFLSSPSLSLCPLWTSLPLPLSLSSFFFSFFSSSPSSYLLSLFLLLFHPLFFIKLLIALPLLCSLQNHPQHGRLGSGQRLVCSASRLPSNGIRHGWGRTRLLRRSGLHRIRRQWRAVLAE